jgi:hypothetical protein
MRGARAWIESHQILTIIIGAGVFAIVGTTAMSNAPAAPQSESHDGAASSTSLSAADAASQFKDLMDTGEKAALVSSYEFSDTERVIYVSDVWDSIRWRSKRIFSRRWQCCSR